MKCAITAALLGRLRWAAPDGYTVLVGAMGTQAINPVLYSELRHDTRQELAPSHPGGRRG